jgi:hypothetical protein
MPIDPSEESAQLMDISFATELMTMGTFAAVGAPLPDRKNAAAESFRPLRG